MTHLGSSALHPHRPSAICQAVQWHVSSHQPDLHRVPVQIYNLNSPQAPHKEIESPLKYQTRCITCFPDHAGFMVGSHACDA